MTEQYRKVDIARLLGEPTRKIQYWVDQGLVIPEIVSKGSKGRAMVFSKQNLIEFAMVKKLQQYDLKLIAISRVLRLLRGENRIFFGKVDFRDFYTNPGWGIDRELIYFASKTDNDFEAILYIKDGIEQQMQTNRLNMSEPETNNALGFLLREKDILAQTMIMLGRVKNQAVNDLNRK